MSYPTELMPTAIGVQSYALPARPEAIPAEAWEAVGARLLEAQLIASPPMRIIGAFDALKDHIDVLDYDGLDVVASCAHQMVLYQFGSRVAEALAVRDAAIARINGR